MILSLSSGLTTVRDAAPATPPAMKYDVICALKNGNTRFFSSAAGLLGAEDGDGALAEVCDVMVEAR